MTDQGKELFLTQGEGDVYTGGGGCVHRGRGTCKKTLVCLKFVFDIIFRQTFQHQPCKGSQTKHFYKLIVKKNIFKLKKNPFRESM